ncbi:MAG: hypothetical protein J5449_09465 [Oscillospiraceae bacterium]|nr:hypothetical protein [Oscillospiraceae bacterium]
MREKRAAAKKAPRIMLLNILIVLMAFVTVVSVVRLVSEVRSSFVRDRYNSMEYSLHDGDYGDMVYHYYYWHYDVDPFSTPSEEEYHVAAYADAAFRHQLFEAAGDGEMADRCLRQMAQAREGTGSLSVSADEVDRILEGIPLYR